MIRGLIHGTSAGSGAHGHVDQVAFENVVQVPVVAGQVLVVPDRVAGGRIRRQGAVGIQHIVPLGAAQPLQRRLRYRGAPVQEPEFRIVARYVAPASYMPAQLVGQVVPAFVSRFAGSRDGPPTPQLVAGFRVVPRQVTAFGAAARRTGTAADDDAGSHHRAAHVPDSGIDGRFLGFPEECAGARIECNEMAVVRQVKQAVPVNRQVAAVARTALVLALAPVFPDQAAVGRIERLDDVARVLHVQGARNDQRRRVLAARLPRAGPGQAQFAHVVAVHLVERTVGPAVVGAAEHQPVAVGRVFEHGPW